MERLLKVHGSGNTFYLLEVMEEDTSYLVQLAQWLCDKDNHAGADGLLVVCPSSVADAKMRVINADGSEASMCGNGLRCVARYVCEKLQVDEALIETMKVNLHVKKEAAIYRELPTYSVEISPVSFDLETLPMHVPERKQIMNEVMEQFSPTILFTAISVPNPHLIGIVEEYDMKHPLHQQMLSQYLNDDNPYCPDGVNVSYVYPLSEDSIFVRTYERGVGFTNACGTAMTASALVTHMTHIIPNKEVTVYNPGGFVKCMVEYDENNYYLRLIGNATVTETCLLANDGDRFKWVSFESTHEQLEYEECKSFVNKKVEKILK